MDPDDWLSAGFEVDDDEPVSNARAERIEAARKAAASYQAKIEEPRVRLFPAASPSALSS